MFALQVIPVPINLFVSEKHHNCSRHATAETLHGKQYRLFPFLVAFNATIPSHNSWAGTHGTHMKAGGEKHDFQLSVNHQFQNRWLMIWGTSVEEMLAELPASSIGGHTLGELDPACRKWGTMSLIVIKTEGIKTTRVNKFHTQKN